MTLIQKWHIQAQSTSTLERTAHQSITPLEASLITLQPDTSIVFVDQVPRTVNVPLAVKQKIEVLSRNLRPAMAQQHTGLYTTEETILKQIRQMMGQV